MYLGFPIIYVDDGLFYEADTSDLRQPFSDGFVTFHISDYGIDGSGVVPYNPLIYFNTTQNKMASYSFSQIWFKNKNEYDCDVDGIICRKCCNYERNYFHIMGVSSSETGRWGKSRSLTDISFSFIQKIESDCSGCTSTQLGNAIRHNSNHEIGHQFDINCENANPPPTDYHDLNDMWCGDCGGGYLNWCQMHSDDEPIENRIDGIDRFCCYNLIADSVFCALDNTKCGESIRFTNDPK